MDDSTTHSETHYLKDPLSLSDLIGDGAQFEINTDFHDDFTDSMLDELSVGSDDDENDNMPVNHSDLVSPWIKPFAELKLQMSAVNEYIHKRITRKGWEEGGMVPDNARVCIRYNAYWEGESAPFDSLFLRGSSFSFYTGRQEVIVGLEQAVRSMCRGEHAQFVISYHLLMGEMGCPPRVKARADGLYIIELVSFNAVGDMNAAQHLNEEDRKKFSILFDKVKEIHLKGCDFFGQSMYKNAITTFERAVNLLNVCHLSNEDEEKAQTAFLIKLYTNLAVCYLKVDKPNKTCVMCKQIRYLTNNKPSCKAIFQEARALLMLDEFERASALLKYALRMEPQNNAISDELNKLEIRYTRHKDGEKQFWRSAFGGADKVTIENKNAQNNDTSEYKEQMRELIKMFKENMSETNLKLPKSMTKDEIRTVSELARQMELNLHISPLDESLYILSK